MKRFVYTLENAFEGLILPYPNQQRVHETDGSVLHHFTAYNALNQEWCTFTLGDYAYKNIESLLGRGELFFRIWKTRDKPALYSSTTVASKYQIDEYARRSLFAFWKSEGRKPLTRNAYTGPTHRARDEALQTLSDMLATLCPPKAITSRAPREAPKEEQTNALPVPPAPRVDPIQWVLSRQSEQLSEVLDGTPVWKKNEDTMRLDVEVRTPEGEHRRYAMTAHPDNVRALQEVPTAGSWRLVRRVRFDKFGRVTVVLEHSCEIIP